MSRNIPYLNTLNRTIPYLNTLTRTIPYFNTLSRTIPSLKTLNRTIPYLNTLPLAANQIRVLRHPSRQPIRIEYYVTRELSATVEAPSRLSARLGWLKPILIHRVFNPPTRLIRSLFYYKFRWWNGKKKLKFDMAKSSVLSTFKN